jgi:transposase
VARRRARAPRGARAVGSVPRDRGPNVTLLAVLGPRGIATSLAVEGAADGPAFDGFVAAFLVPALRPGQMAVPDNLAVHKSARARALVEAAGARLLFLPPYSPDVDPIEAVFAKVKEALRTAAARTRDDLLAATKAALDAVTAEDAAGCYADRGFPRRCNPCENRSKPRTHSAPLRTASCFARRWVLRSSNGWSRGVHDTRIDERARYEQRSAGWLGRQVDLFLAEKGQHPAPR